MARTYLHLEDGERLEGESFGHAGQTSGEVVFLTAMVGYPQSLTDPSYNGQILVFTYPLIGNYGVPRPKRFSRDILANFESPRIWVRGVVVSHSVDTPSHYSSSTTFSRWLTSQNVSGIMGIDTRKLTQKLREFGTLRGIISSRTRVAFSSVTTHLVVETSISTRREYKPKYATGKHIVLIDCGVKHGILRALLSRGLAVTRIPWDGDPLAIKHIDGVVCSNGPGDPKACEATIKNIRRVVDRGIPFLGICFGHQLLALAMGADTYKLPYGHRGINQPCGDTRNGKAYITSQNHGYAVNRRTLQKSLTEWFVNLNDKTNEGLIDEKRHIYTTQFHPEGNPGPNDTEWVFGLI